MYEKIQKSNSLSRGAEPHIGYIIRASNPSDLLAAQMHIRKELQLSQYENQKRKFQKFVLSKM